MGQPPTRPILRVSVLSGRQTARGGADKQMG